MVKYKVRLTNSFQTGCQKFQSTRKMFLPGISRELHGTQPSISSPLAVDCAEVGCWLLPVSYLAATLVHFTIKWLDSILACFCLCLFSNRPRVSTHWSDGSSKSSWFTVNVFNMFFAFQVSNPEHAAQSAHWQWFMHCTCTWANEPQTAVKFAHGCCEYLCTISAPMWNTVLKCSAGNLSIHVFQE